MPLEEPPSVTFTDVFSLRRPKDAKAGVASGLKSFAKGVFGGAVSIVAAPVYGATQEGFPGFARGVVTGVAGAVILPVCGVTVGAVQIARGIYQQGVAFSERHKGKVWDQDTRQWIEAPSNALATVNDGEIFRKWTRNALPPGVLTDSEDYYDLLQVPRSAPPEQIKRAYYELARRWHPDKNPGDEKAKERFQALGEAYQVLSNNELRARYDREGRDGLNVNFIDAAEIYSMLFGHEKFEALVGELLVASSAKYGAELKPEMQRQRQEERIAKLALHLSCLLKRYLEDPEGFRLAQRDEATDLASASFGETMLHTIGRVYELQADIYLGGFLEGTIAKMKSGTETIRTQFQAASAALKVYQHQQRLEKQDEDQRKKQVTGGPAPAEPNGGLAPEGPLFAEAGDARPGTSSSASASQQERRRAEEDTLLPMLMDAMWAANEMDIQMTLSRVCRKVLAEKAADRAVQRARAMALKEMGQIFNMAAAPATYQAPRDVKSQLEEAMFKVMEKRHGVQEGVPPSA